MKEILISFIFLMFFSKDHMSKNQSPRILRVIGCEKDFIHNCDSYRNYVVNLFETHKFPLDNSVNQLKGVDRIIQQNKLNPDFNNVQFIYGMISYCGEIIRRKTGGRWAMDVYKAEGDYVRDRYFPKIIGKDGKEHIFSGGIEMECVYSEKPNLHDIIMLEYFEFNIPVKKADTWINPRINKEQN